MKKTILTMGLIASIFLSGCGYKEGESTATQKSYLYFTGNTHDTTISVDNGKQFSVQVGKNNQYSIKPGKHLVEVYRNNALIIKRKIFISDSIAKEIEVQ